jgi:protein SCO1/2
MNSFQKLHILGVQLGIILIVFGISWAVAKDDAPSLLEQSKMVVEEKSDAALWIEEKTGQYLPLDLEFVDEAGQPVRLREIVDRPTILLPIYFYCPNICSKNLANLAIALSSLSLEPGKDYRAIALSFNEAESFEDAARAKKNYLKIVGDDFPSDGWRFLTGSIENIQAVTDTVGFRFKKIDDETFIHPAALMTIDKDGQVIRYVYGSFLAGDIEMGLLDAAKGSPSMSVKRLLAFCFNYDPDKNKSVFQFVKIGVLLLFGITITIVFIYIKRTRSKNQGGR